MAGNALSVGSFTNGSGGISMPKGGDINLGGVSSADVPCLATTVVTQAFPDGSFFGQGGRIA
jgi:hypothetical protein